MGLPLLGLLALGGAAAGRGQIQGMFDKQDARRFERSGVNLDDGTNAGLIAQQFAQAGQGASTLAMNSVADARGQQQADASNATRIQAAGIGAAAGMMRANLAVQQHEAIVETEKLRKQAFTDLGGNPLAYGTPLEKQTWEMAGQDPKMYENMSPKVQEIERTKAQIAEMQRRTEVEQANQTAAMQGMSDAVEETGLQVQLQSNLKAIDELDNPSATPAQIEQAAQLKPLAQQQETLATAFQALDGVGRGAWNLTETDEASARIQVNRAVEGLMMRDWAKVRSDAMGETDREAWTKVYPQLDSNPSDGEVAVIRRLLEVAAKDTQDAVDRINAEAAAMNNGDMAGFLRSVGGQ